MNVLEIINSLGTVGGAETFAVSLCSFLTKKTNLFVIILHGGNNPDLLKRLQSACPNRVFVFNKNLHFDPKIYSHLHHFIRDNRIDVIHTENNGLISAFFSCLFMNKRPRIFHTVHNPAEKECGGFLSRTITRFCFRSRFATPVGISKTIGETVRSFYHLSFCPVIDNGIDTRRFHSDVPLSERKNDCVIMARMEPQKNYFFVLDVFAEAHRLDPTLVFDIYGAGSQRSEIEKRILENGVDYIHLHNVTSQPEVVLANTKVFFLGSKYEGNPMSVLEALSSGCIPVVSKVGGIPDVVSSENGMAFLPLDPKPFARAIVDVCSFPLKYERMSKSNVTYTKKYSFELVADRYLSLFASC